MVSNIKINDCENCGDYVYEGISHECVKENVFDFTSQKKPLKDRYIDDEELADEFCKRVNCRACFNVDESGEHDGYGCEYRDNYLMSNENLVVDLDRAYEIIKKKNEAMENVLKKHNDFIKKILGKYDGSDHCPDYWNDVEWEADANECERMFVELGRIEG